MPHRAQERAPAAHLWQEVPGRVKDFVRNPKPNGYQSIHPTLRLPDGRLVEVQLRTRQMHERAEHGSAAHHLYKGGATEAGNRELGTAATRAVAALLPAAESTRWTDIPYTDCGVQAGVGVGGCGAPRGSASPLSITRGESLVPTPRVRDCTPVCD